MVVLANDTPQSGLLPTARDGRCEDSVIADFVVQRFVVCAAAWMVGPHVVNFPVALPTALLVEQNASIVREEARDFRWEHVVISHGNPWSVACCRLCVLHHVSQGLLTL